MSYYISSQSPRSHVRYHRGYRYNGISGKGVLDEKTFIKINKIRQVLLNCFITNVYHHLTAISRLVSNSKSQSTLTLQELQVRHTRIQSSALSSSLQYCL